MFVVIFVLVKFLVGVVDFDDGVVGFDGGFGDFGGGDVCFVELLE